jgi:hypothetical protein
MVHGIFPFLGPSSLSLSFLPYERSERERDIHAMAHFLSLVHPLSLSLSSLPSFLPSFLPALSLQQLLFFSSNLSPCLPLPHSSDSERVNAVSMIMHASREPQPTTRAWASSFFLAYDMRSNLGERRKGDAPSHRRGGDQRDQWGYQLVRPSILIH